MKKRPETELDRNEAIMDAALAVMRDPLLRRSAARRDKIVANPVPVLQREGVGEVSDSMLNAASKAEMLRQLQAECPEIVDCDMRMIESAMTTRAMVTIAVWTADGTRFMDQFRHERRQKGYEACGKTLINQVKAKRPKIPDLPKKPRRGASRSYVKQGRKPFALV